MVKWIDLADVQLTPDVIRDMPACFAHQYLALPIEVRDGILVVAVPDPTEYDLEAKLRFHLNREVDLVGAPIAQLKFAIWRQFGPA
jgi:hypothetical protein